jgi:hypothetical protein
MLVGLYIIKRAIFYQKPNKNTLIKINKYDERYIADPNFIWCNLTQNKKINLIKRIINPYVKTILFMILNFWFRFLSKSIFLENPYQKTCHKKYVNILIN